MKKRGPPRHPAPRSPPAAALAKPVLPPAGSMTGGEKPFRNSFMALGVSIGVLTGAYLLSPLIFRLPTSMLDSIVFVLRADLFILIWGVVATRAISVLRLIRAGDITLGNVTPSREHFQHAEDFKQDTLQQTVLAVGAHLALATLCTGRGLGLIVGSVLLFFASRILFLTGMRHPLKMTVARLVTIFPTMIFYAIAFISLVATVF